MRGFLFSLGMGSVLATGAAWRLLSPDLPAQAPQGGCGCVALARPEPPVGPSPQFAAFSRPPLPAKRPTIHAPFFGRQPIPFEQTAIAWFGTLGPLSNHADIRVGANESELYVYVAAFDRHLWHDLSPSPQRLTEWDAVTLLLDVGAGSRLSERSFRFVGQLYGDPDPRYRAAFRWSGRGWTVAKVPFDAKPGWRGNALNNEEDTDRGWAMGFRIPWSSLGMAAAPARGSSLRMAVLLHDRDAPNEPPLPVQTWPRAANAGSPGTWGLLRLGLPTYSSSARPVGSTVIRRPTQGSPLVPDADVGGTSSNQCPGDERHIWHEWANLNWGRSGDFNVQNQSDVADWPCFSRYYISFPLDAVPKRKEIVSAKLVLHQFGSAGGAAAQPSWIQVLIAEGPWKEDSITWNNAPQALENVGGAWVPPLVEHPGWPGVPREWDVTYAVAKAYAAGTPVHLVLYESDSAYHSGKYFVSCDTGDWNAAGRPRLEVVWGERARR